MALNPKNIEKNKFKPGQSGNPKGRPKDLISKHLLKFAKAKENIFVEIKDEDGEIHKVKIANGQDVAMTIMNKAASGEGWAVVIAMDRLEGKVAQALEHTGKDGKDLPPMPLLFLSADKLSEDQIQEYINKNIEPSE